MRVLGMLCFIGEVPTLRHMVATCSKRVSVTRSFLAGHAHADTRRSGVGRAFVRLA